MAPLKTSSEMWFLRESYDKSLNADKSLKGSLYYEKSKGISSLENVELAINNPTLWESIRPYWL